MTENGISTGITRSMQKNPAFTESALESSTNSGRTAIQHAEKNPRNRVKIPCMNRNAKSPHAGLAWHGQLPEHGRNNSNGGPLDSVSRSTALSSIMLRPAGRFSYTTGRYLSANSGKLSLTSIRLTIRVPVPVCDGLPVDDDTVYDRLE